MNSEQRLANRISVPIKVEKIKIGKYLINYMIAGGGKPLLLIHGGNIGWGQWYPNIASFAKYFTVFALDLPGAGRSSIVDYSHLDLERDFVDVAAKFIKIKKIKNPDILGSSIGGWIALKLSLRKDLALHRLVLADSIGFADSLRLADRIIGIYPLANLLSRTILTPVRTNKNIESFLRDVFYDKNVSIWQEFVDYFYETMASSHNLLLISKLSGVFGMREEFKLKDKLTKVSKPTLIIWGEFDKFTDPKKIYNNFKLIPNVQVHIVKGAGHIPSIEKSDEFNETVIKFLKS